ncbi:scarecrow-like protein 14 [Phalaenopsis equestris]|uniref:scarecrow-like protein 14 n=1 Tax=Phalaenopsis equestris TaxID=78828 RepID=UPI0009E1D865|nr:scarecrow-like protein 14 [Phalaenopsis equestris]XP_020596442.1 scarecrow-like protein 14 [Phalaenopsis equestris]
MMKNTMINGTVDDFKYKDFLSVDDVLSQQESFLNPSFGEPPLFNEQDFFVELPNFSPVSHEADSHENSEIYSGLVLDYIHQMLMEEDMEDKFDMLESNPALEATEKPFYEIIGEKYPPSPDRPPLYSSPSSEGSENHRSHDFHTGVDGFPDNNQDPAYPETTELFHSRIFSTQASISSENDVASVLEQFKGDPDDLSDLFFKNLPASQFEKGVEEAMKFLPSEAKLIVDAGAIGYDSPHELKDLASIESKVEDARGRRQKGRHDINFDLEEQRSNKQSAISYEEPTVSSEMFDMVLLCSDEKLPKVISTIREAMQNEAASKNSPAITELKEPGKGRKSRVKKKQPKKEVVDLQTILMQCAQTVATGDHQRAHESLRQIRQHSSPHGDAWQRLAHYFADGLEARLAGTGSVIYNALVAKRKTASDVLKAYQVYLAASPLKMVSYHFSNQTILNTIGNATRVHILDYGIYFGFQWPPFLKMLSALPGGPPKLRITGIDVPQPGFRPSERIEETGHRLYHYAERFGIPFEYQVVASKLDEVNVEDLHLEEEEVLIVNCVFRITSLGDETMDVDCPRDRFLNNIRKLNPALFVNVTSNGSYGAPFFLTRFREALYHFSALFDMLEMTVPREHEQRMLVERDLYGKCAINVISCEGAERLERPETYKQAQVRCLRAGFEQLPVSSEITKMVKCGVKVHYHKDFSVDEDGRWLLLGWRGRIFIGLSAWKPRCY